jgi:Na+/citrate or Na+/malate symporter
MSEIVSDISGTMDATEVLSMFVPALALGNIFAIIAAGLLDRLGKIKPSTTGNGVLLRGFKVPKAEKPPLTVRALGTGLFLSCVFFTLGKVWGMLIPAVHSYALMILSVAVVKVFNLLPGGVQNDCDEWYRFVVKNFTPALLVGIGIAYTDLGAVLAALSFEFIFLVFITIITIVLVTGFLGRLVGFYFVESALTSGLGMADMGGTGDVAVLSAAKRMELMPFMQISSRLGGALILVLVGILAPLLF